MSTRFIIKQTPKRTICRRHIGNNVSESNKVENKVAKIDKNMDTKEKVELVNKMLHDEDLTTLNKKGVKKLKNDKGLIERAELNKTVITEDNKELLND